MNTIDGKTVSECFSLVSRFGKEIYALKDALENLLTEQITDCKTLPCVLAGYAKNDDRLDENKWVYTDVVCSIPLKTKGKRKVERYIGFQISMTGDGINLAGNKEPLLHVFCWACPVNFEEFYIKYPIEEIEDDPENRFKIIDERLVLWGGQDEEWSEREWVYSLRLISINSMDDLKKYVVIPVLGLLKNENVREVLSDEWFDKALIRYPEIK